LQHERNFDVAHPEFRFEILMQEGTTISIEQAIEVCDDETDLGVGLAGIPSSRDRLLG
jgi:hypothetical protein